MSDPAVATYIETMGLTERAKVLDSYRVMMAKKKR